MKYLILSIIFCFSAHSYAQTVPTDLLLKALDLKMVSVEGGSFHMGSDSGVSNEKPIHTVTLRSFSIGQFEVTQKQWQLIMGSNPSGFNGCPNCPVEDVKWKDIQEFLARLNKQTGGRYRLPTEAEWEYACRAGTTTAFAYGPALRSGMANFDGYEEYDATLGTIFNPAGAEVGQTSVVGGYAANAWGLYDMHGNVFEWCLDWWAYQLPGGSVTDPRGPSSGSNRVIRGGCWYDDGRICRSACRAQGGPGYQGNDVGFRIVLAPPGH